MLQTNVPSTGGASTQPSVAHEGGPRWDGQDLRAFTGTYGDYLVTKVSRVFPHLQEELE